MKQTQMWTYVFLIFLTLQSRSSACEGLDRYMLMSKEALDLLWQMSDSREQNVLFPGHLYRVIGEAKVEDQVRFLALTLDHIIHLMDDAKEHRNSVKWNPRTVDHFLSVLHRQSTDLKQCVAQYQKASPKEDYEIKIYRHFKKLKKNLKKKNYSAQAWEQIRKAVKSHLQRMDIMASNAKKLMRQRGSQS